MDQIPRREGRGGEGMRGEGMTRWGGMDGANPWGDGMGWDGANS